MEMIQHSDYENMFYDREPISNYAWDDGKSQNDWTQSALMQVLNEGAYWSKTLGKCPRTVNLTVSCDFSVAGLSDKAKSLISYARWLLGGHSSNNLNAKQFYEKERGKEVFEENATEWPGKIGLLYPSDYLFAVNPRLTECKDVLNNNYTKFNCYLNNWLYTGEVQWTIMHRNNEVSIYRISYIGENSYPVGNIYFNGPNWANISVRPVVYLSTNIKITSGNGTMEITLYC